MGTAPSRKVRVWGPLARVVHSGLVVASATAWLTAGALQPPRGFQG